MKANRAYALLILLFVLSFGYWMGGAVSLNETLRHGPERARLPLVFGYRMPAIAFAQPEAAEAGAHVGDTLVEFDGRPFTGYDIMRDAVRSARPGSALPAVIRHPDGTAARIEIRLAAERPAPAAISEWLRDIAVHLVFPLFCLVLGFWVAAARPQDGNAWLLLAIMISLEFLIPMSSSREPWQVLRVVWGMLAGFSWPVWMMLFGIYFPERSVLDRGFPWAKWLVLLILTMASLPLLVWQAGMEFSFAAVAWLRPYLTRIDLVRQIVGMAAISLFFANMGAKSGTASTKDVARRIRFVWLGSAIGLTPGFVVALIGLFRGSGFGEGLPAWLDYLTIGCLAIFPLTLAYTILVQRAMDVRVAIRQSVRYTLARGGLWLVGALMFTVAMKIFVDVSQKGTFTPEQAGLLALGAALLLMRRRYRGRVQRWVDRRFFREAYSAEQMLSDLSNQARKFVDAGPLLETVTHRISETLHVPRISVLLRDGDGYRLAGGGAGPAATADAVLVPEARSIAHLRAARGPAVVYFDNPDAWLRDAPPDERQTLQRLDAQLLLPLTGRDDLIGVMALGPKRSEEPYSKTDLQLLQSVADQTGLAIENSRLLSSLAEEAARRERFNRELEIAREVQERLFPQSYPSIPGLDCAGHCRPAQGVGGDYYDFIALRDAAWGHARTGEGRLGIAVGDVSGKGISAALLMASLRASLRGQTLGGPADLAALMRNVNALLYEASAANRYATFFYAQYDPSDHTLAYVNAGHNPPIVLRGDEVLRLEADGPVVGLLPRAQYGQSELVLAPGDILLAYTDGISEAMTVDDEEWGEERMIAAARACRGLAAGDMIDKMMAAADAFTAGAPQHDDMTLVIVKLVGC
ncbi:MAG: GAF domain-containing SpoIIE family protein phosphatase [Bryobacteraceae bacterium]|jgi:sigma-B regulation protein RsbU (phosphoserine phosphatase)